MEVSFEPYKKISFRSHLLYETPEAFARAITVGVPLGSPGQGTLFWANGVLFRYFAYPPSESVAKEYVNGNLIWDHIEIAPMPSYTTEIHPPDKPMITIGILNVSSHSLFGPFTAWVRDNLFPRKASSSPVIRKAKTSSTM